MKMSTVLYIEWVRLLRSPLRLIAIGFYFLCGIYAVFSAMTFVNTIRESIEQSETQKREMQEQTLAWYDNKQKGPEYRPWVDIHQPLWAEWYSGTYIAKTPTPLGHISLGLSDTRSHFSRINRFTSPFDQSQKMELVNPEKQLAGNFDLAFVWLYLLPMLLILLTYDIIGHEDDHGISGLIVSQTGSLHKWLFYRIAFAGIVATVPTVLLAVIGGAMGGELINLQLLLMILSVLLYILFWLSLIATVLVFRKGSAINALALAASWLFFCLLVPAFFNQLIELRYPVGYSTDLTDSHRQQIYDLYDADVRDLLDEFYWIYPALQQTPYASDTTRISAIDRHIYEALALKMVQKADSQMISDIESRYRLALNTIVFNPVFLLQNSLNLLAGNETKQDLSFKAKITRTVNQKMDMVIDYAWRQQPVEKKDYLKFAGVSPQELTDSHFPGVLSMLLPIFWSLIFGIAAAVVLSKQ